MRLVRKEMFEAGLRTNARADTQEGGTHPLPAGTGLTSPTEITLSKALRVRQVSEVRAQLANPGTTGAAHLRRIATIQFHPAIGAIHIVIGQGRHGQ